MNLADGVRWIHRREAGGIAALLEACRAYPRLSNSETAKISVRCSNPSRPKTS